MKEFEIAKEEINNIKGAKAKLDYIFNDIFDLNGIDEPLERIYLLTGTISSFVTYGGTQFYIIKSIHTLLNKPEKQLINPYDYGTALTSHIGMRIRSDVQVGDKVVFSVTKGPTRKESEIFNTNDYYTFAQIGINDSMSIDERLNIIKEYSMFFEYKEQITTLLEYRGTLLKKKTKLEELEEYITQRTAELEEIKAQEQIIAPDGIDARKAELEKIQKEAERIKPLQERINQVQRKAKFFLSIEDGSNDITESNVYTGKNLVDDLSKHLKYVYSKDTLISFLMALSTTQTIILFGKPGTGKTTFVSEVSRGLGAKCDIISVQNNWTDSSDLLGYYSPIDKTYESTPFVDALIDANKEWQQKQYESRLHIICLDEMNLARVEYYFASFLSMLQLEPNQRWIRVLPKHVQDELDEYEKTRMLPDGKEHLKQLKEYANFLLPPNVRFVGTINSDDTTNGLSPKVVDRSFFIEITVAEHSEEQNPVTTAEYYPLSIFEINTTSASDDLSVFSGENSRFINYAKIMLSMYKNQLVADYNADDFCDRLITAKVLPALRKISDFNYNDSERYPVAVQKFEDHKPTRGDAYDFLGG